MEVKTVAVNKWIQREIPTLFCQTQRQSLTGDSVPLRPLAIGLRAANVIKHAHRRRSVLRECCR